MKAIYKNILIEQGATFSSTLNVVDRNGDPVDLSTYAVRGTLGKSYTDASPIDFTCVITDAATGEITFSLNSAETLALNTFNINRYVYDIEIYKDSAESGIEDITRVQEGIAIITPNI